MRGGCCRCRGTCCCSITITASAVPAIAIYTSPPGVYIYSEPRELFFFIFRVWSYILYTYFTRTGIYGRGVLTYYRHRSRAFKQRNNSNNNNTHGALHIYVYIGTYIIPERCNNNEIYIILISRRGEKGYIITIIIL